MRFLVCNSVPGNVEEIGCVAFLLVDSWDDWYKFRTAFTLIVYDGDGTRHVVGKLKIGQIGLKGASVIAPGQRAPDLPEFFEALDHQFFSLGQDESYYETLWAIGDDVAHEILISLRDCALDLDIFRTMGSEEVMSESLLRSVSVSSVFGKLHRLATGNAELTSFHFEFQMADTGLSFPSPNLEFKVIPNGEPPTNVHVVIGRNGAGKTRLLQSLAKVTLDPNAPADESGKITKYGGEDGPDGWAFASLVYISFSVFDDFTLPPSREAKLRAAQVSLRGEKSAKVADTNGRPTKAGRELFVNSLATCRLGARRNRWREAIHALESDPLFEEADFASLLEEDDDDWRGLADGLFEKLSSGHAVVLLTITKLVELVDERTLVLMDEPEGHLHPPLLSALIRSLSDLLIKRNGVAIIATHSPVILQEVPTACVWKLERTGGVTVAERPRIETFGENVGTLTSEIFKLEVTSSGFNKLLADAVKEEQGDYDGILRRFDNKLGAEAKAIVRGMAAIYRTKTDEFRQ